MDKSKIYLQPHRRLQEKYQTTALADKQEELIVHDAFTDDEIDFISSRDMFFLSTINDRLEPTVSYKGGQSGFVKVINNTILFPSYDGNGMYLSAGNIYSNKHVGLLFIDFEVPRRLRVQGLATLDEGEIKKDFPGAEFVVRVTPTLIWVNCPRYIHNYQKQSDSKYTPAASYTPPIANWKRLDVIADVLPEKDAAEVHRLGEITIDEYQKMIIDKEA